MADRPPRTPEKAELDAALRTAVNAASRLGHAALDAVERALFGEVGGAAKAVEREAGRDGLDVVRERWGKPEGPAEAPPPAEDPVERARAELERLKAARRAREEDPEAAVRKRTL